MVAISGRKAVIARAHVVYERRGHLAREQLDQAPRLRARGAREQEENQENASVSVTMSPQVHFARTRTHTLYKIR